MKTKIFNSILSNYKAVFLDSYGVIKNHAGLIPNVQDAIDHIRLIGMPMRILTNDASRSPLLLAQKFEEAGLRGIKSSEIITSGMMAKEYLMNKGKKGKVAYLGTNNSADYIREANLEPISITEVTEVNMHEISALVFLDDEGYDWNKDLNTTVNLLRNYEIPAIVANSDVIYPVSKKNVAIATGGVAALVENILGRQFIHYGKPDSQMFMYGFEQLNKIRKFNRKDILMVGDTLHTDILGANKFGISTVLVLTGNTSEEEAHIKIKASGVIPDYICKSIAD